MTIQEAGDLYKKHDCSLFRMGREDWCLSKEYDKLNIPREQEEIWESELFYELAKRIKMEGSYDNLYVMRDLIERKLEKTKLETMAKALQNVIYDEPEKNEYVSRIIFGSNKALSDRKGLVFGAYDIDEKELAAEFLSYAVHLLNEIREIEELEDRVKKDLEICHEIDKALELKTDFDFFTS